MLMELNYVSRKDFESKVLLFIESLQKSDSKSEDVHWLLSGGLTPIPLYRKFRELNFIWSRMHFWLADERCVEKSSDDSNERVIKEAIGHEILSKAVFHSYPDGNPNDSALTYGKLLRNVKEFNMSILGIGEDGHTASLFPGNYLGEYEDSPDVIAVFDSPKPPAERMSLSVNRINKSRNILFLATGDSKKRIVESVRSRDLRFPASYIHGIERTEIFFTI